MQKTGAIPAAPAPTPAEGPTITSAETTPGETAAAETASVETIPAETAPAETAPAETAPAETAPATYKVTFTRSGSLGINLMSRTKTEPRVFVKSLGELGQAVELGAAGSGGPIIRPGHLLVGVDGESVREMNIAEVFARMARCSRPCTLEFQPAADDFAVTLQPGEGKFGARIVNREGKVRIDVVHPGMSAQYHGVCVGDWISRVGDERITSQGAKRTCQLIATASRPLVMIMSRGNEIHDHQQASGVMTQEQLDALLVDALEEEMEEAAARQEAALQQQKSASKSRVAERLRIRKALKDQPAILRATPFFSELADDATGLHAVVDDMHYRKCAAGQNLVTEGDDANEFMVIVEGIAACFRKGVAGELRRLQSKDVFGIAAVMTGADGGHVRQATVTAVKTCHLLVLTRSKYDELRAAGTINAETHEKALQMASAYAKADLERPAIEVEEVADSNEKTSVAEQMQLQQRAAEAALREADAQEKNMTQEEIVSRNASIVAEIERNAAEEALKLRQRSAKLQASSASRVQERLKARNALKHSNLLRSTKMFSGLASDNMHTVVDAMEFRFVESGQNVCTQGDEGNSMMVIMSGRCELRKEYGAGEKATVKVLGVLGATATIGEPSLMPGDHVRSATVVATEATRVLVLTRGKYAALVEKGVLSKKETMQRVKTSVKKMAAEDAKRLATLLNGAPCGEVVVGGI